MFRMADRVGSTCDPGVVLTASDSVLSNWPAIKSHHVINACVDFYAIYHAFSLGLLPTCPSTKLVALYRPAG